MRRSPVSAGANCFETIERASRCRSWREQDYEYANGTSPRVGIRYHVEVAGFYNSVPHHRLMGGREQGSTTAPTLFGTRHHRDFPPAAIRVASTEAALKGGPQSRHAA